MSFWAGLAKEMGTAKADLLRKAVLELVHDELIIHGSISSINGNQMRHWHSEAVALQHRGFTTTLDDILVRNGLTSNSRISQVSMLINALQEEHRLIQTKQTLQAENTQNLSDLMVYLMNYVAGLSFKVNAMATASVYTFPEIIKTIGVDGNFPLLASVTNTMEMAEEFASIYVDRDGAIRTFGEVRSLGLITAIATLNANPHSVTTYWLLRTDGLFASLIDQLLLTTLELAVKALNLLLASAARELGDALKLPFKLPRPHLTLPKETTESISEATETSVKVIDLSVADLWGSFPEKVGPFDFPLSRHSKRRQTILVHTLTPFAANDITTTARTVHEMIELDSVVVKVDGESVPQIDTEGYVSGTGLLSAGVRAMLAASAAAIAAPAEIAGTAAAGAFGKSLSGSSSDIFVTTERCNWQVALLNSTLVVVLMGDMFYQNPITKTGHVMVDNNLQLPNGEFIFGPKSYGAMPSVWYEEEIDVDDLGATRTVMYPITVTENSYTLKPNITVAFTLIGQAIAFTVGQPASFPIIPT